MTIYLFDFDNTILKIPYQESIEYMDKSESLNSDLEFEVIQDTKRDYEKALKDKSGHLFILSNRVLEVKNSLKNLLKEYGYKFEDYYLIENGDRNKGNRLKKILKKYPNCTRVKYWEDKDKHINSLKETIKDYPNIDLEVIKTI
jgi:hypothetical protein|tara:strand:- start:3665 stop:4096 length:432 start_codon:yes stop_codon:yes gene_type:complete